MARIKQGRISGLPSVPVITPGPTQADIDLVREKEAMANAAQRYNEMQRELTTYGRTLDDPQGSSWTGNTAQGMGPIASARKATGDLPEGPQMGSGDRKKAGKSGWDKKREKVAAAIDNKLQGAGKAVDKVIGPHASQGLGRIAQAGDIAKYAIPVVGDMIDISETAQGLVNNAMEGDWLGMAGWGAAGAASLLPAMFIGPAAKNFPVKNADDAYDLLKQGVDPETIRARTGIIFDASGIPRFEIDDSKARLTPKGERFAKGAAIDKRSPPMPFDQAFDHPELFENYPQMRNYMTRFAEDGGPAGAFYPAWGGQGPEVEAYGSFDQPAFGYKAPKNLQQVIMHEGQHAVDNIEDAAFGSMPGTVPKEIRDKYPNLSEFQLYKRAAGETLADTTAMRANLDADQRGAISPYHGVGSQYDAPYQEQFPRSEQWVERNDPRFAPEEGYSIMHTAYDPYTPEPVTRILANQNGEAYGGAYTERPVMGSVPEAAPKKKRMGPIALGAHPTTDPNYIAATTLANGGYSVNVPTGQNPTDGYMMGMYANTDPRNMVVTGNMTPDDARAFYGTNKKVLQGEDKYFGTWHNPDDGKTYLDVSRRFGPDEKRAATKFGERTGQLAGFDVAAMDSFPVGNWEQFINSPEFMTRMNEMADEGGKFLGQYPTRQWWNMMGTDIEKTYGPVNTPYMAGYTAATAPNAQPRENLQTASEYMRRHIKGEPVIQPEWRVGDAGGPPMSRKPGTKIGMEGTRVDNLERARSGGPLGGPKVESERRAMLGDPDAVVLDRWHARLAEDPNRGILTEAQEGTVSRENYPKLEDRFRQAAAARGMTPRDFSADVWTGVREKVRGGGDLYGTKYKPSAVRGESKAYADVWTDLVKEKAAFLKITPQEMMARLKSGDANLLSVLPFIPGGAALLREFYGPQEPEEQ
jgi:hypothetical protein